MPHWKLNEYQTLKDYMTEHDLGVSPIREPFGREPTASCPPSRPSSQSHLPSMSQSATLIYGYKRETGETSLRRGESGSAFPHRNSNETVRHVIDTLLSDSERTEMRLIEFGCPSQKEINEQGTPFFWACWDLNMKIEHFGLPHGRGWLYETDSPADSSDMRIGAEPI